MTNDNDMMYEATEYRPAAYALVDTEDEGEVRLEVDAESQSHSNGGKKRSWSCSALLTPGRIVVIPAHSWLHLFDAEDELIGATHLRITGEIRVGPADSLRITWVQTYHDGRLSI